MDDLLIENQMKEFVSTWREKKVRKFGIFEVYFLKRSNIDHITLIPITDLSVIQRHEKFKSIMDGEII